MHVLTENHRSGLFKFALATGFLIAATALARAETDYFWTVSGEDGEASAFLAGCEQCDDIRLTLTCTTKPEQITLTPFMDIKQGEDMDTADVEMVIDEDASFTQESFMELNLMEDILQPIVEIKKGAPLIGALVSGSELTINVRGQSDTYSLLGAGQAIGTMLDFCKKPAKAE